MIRPGIGHAFGVASVISKRRKIPNAVLSAPKPFDYDGAFSRM
jgi:hypothetical protein